MCASLIYMTNPHAHLRQGTRPMVVQVHMHKDGMEGFGGLVGCICGGTT